MAYSGHGMMEEGRDAGAQERAEFFDVEDSLGGGGSHAEDEDRPRSQIGTAEATAALSPSAADVQAWRRPLEIVLVGWRRRPLEIVLEHRSHGSQQEATSSGNAANDDAGSLPSVRSEAKIRVEEPSPAGSASPPPVPVLYEAHLESSLASESSRDNEELTLAPAGSAEGMDATSESPAEKSEAATKRVKKVRFAVEDNDDEERPRRRRLSLDAPAREPQVVRFQLPSGHRHHKHASSSSTQAMRTVLPQVERFRRNTVKYHNTIQVYPDPPPSLVFKLMDSQQFRHFPEPGRAKAWNALVWIMGFVSTVAFLVCMVMFGLYLHLQPRIPRLRIESFDFEAYLTDQQLEDRGRFYAYSTDVWGLFKISYHNINTHADLYSHYIEGTIFFNGIPLAKSYVRDFMVARDSVKSLSFVIDSRNVLLPLRVGYTLLKEATKLRIDLVCEFIIKARLTALGRLLTSRIFWQRTRCYIVYADQLLQEGQICKEYNY